MAKEKNNSQINYNLQKDIKIERGDSKAEDINNSSNSILFIRS